MKKLFALLLAFVLAFGVVACTEEATTTEAATTEAATTEEATTTEEVTTLDPDRLLVDEDKSYWATGQFAGWGDAAGNTMYQMEAIAATDAIVADLDVEGAALLYAKLITLPAGEAGWTATYTIDGTETTFDGNLTVKMIRTSATDEDNIPEWWAQSPESGAITNLTEDTLYIPPFVEENVDGAGTWNDNPVALEAGTYFMVFAEYEDGSRAFGLVDIDTLTLEDADKSYWSTGQFANWGDAAGNEMYQMDAISMYDPRVDGLALEGVELLYLLEVTLPAGEAGWTAVYTIDGTETTFDGNLTVKMIRTSTADVDNIPEWWAQSPESGAIINLTEDTLYIPPFVEENVDGAGTWNDNPVALEAGTYYMVFAEYADGTRGIGLVAVPTVA